MADLSEPKLGLFPQSPPWNWTKLPQQASDNTSGGRSTCADGTSSRYRFPAFDQPPTKSSIPHLRGGLDAAPCRGELVSTGQAQHALEVIPPATWNSETANYLQRASSFAQDPCQSTPQSTRGLIYHVADDRQHKPFPVSRPETRSRWRQAKSPIQSARDSLMLCTTSPKRRRNIGLGSQCAQLSSSRNDEVRPGARLPQKDWRMSYWAEVDTGVVHRRKLSERLNEVLGVDFQMPILNQQLTGVADKLGDLNIQRDPECDGRSDDCSNGAPERRAIHDSSFPHIDLSSNCCGRCSSGVICEHQSSEDFQRFRYGYGHQHHKQQDSISSTRCMISIPRARFRTDARRGRPRQSSTTLGSHDIVRLAEEHCLYENSIWQSRHVEDGISLVPELRCSTRQQHEEQPQSLSSSSRLSSFSRPFYTKDANGSHQSFTSNIETSRRFPSQVTPVTPPKQIQRSRFHDYGSSRGASDSSSERLPSLQSVSTLSSSPQSPLLTPLEIPNQACFRCRIDLSTDKIADRESIIDDPFFEGGTSRGSIEFGLFEAESVVLRPVRPRMARKGK